MLTGFDPGANVLHPTHGPCRVLGVEHVTAAGERFDALAIAPAYVKRAIIKIPMSKVSEHAMRVLTPAEVAEALETWQPPMSRARAWRHFLMTRGGNRGREARASNTRMAASVVRAA